MVGGGWAGLAAAVELVRHGIPVTVLEAARQLGGRARCVRFGAHRIDNGQHLMIGAYREMLGLLRTLGMEEQEVFVRRPLRLRLRSSRGRDVGLRAPLLPAPLHLAAGLFRATGLSAADKFGAARFWRGLARRGFTLEQDVSVAELLARHAQPEPLTRALWAPLCLAALNAPIERASAELFVRVLQETFGMQRCASDLLIPRIDLGTAIPEPALDFIEAHGGKVMLGRRVLALELHDGAVTGVRLADGVLQTGHVILAVPHTACRRLLMPHPPLRAIAERLAGLGNEPICTAYLRYPAQVRLDGEMIGVLGGTAQWVFDRAVCGQPGLIAVVISADGQHLALDNATLARQIADELARLFPRWPPPLDSLVIREKRATFACRPGVNALRPAPATPVRGCWLAGDYTATGLPATLEGAIRSGLECARAILQNF